MPEETKAAGVKTLTYENDFKEFIQELSAGNLCRIDEAMFDYFLEVLPPAFMGRNVALINGRMVHADFGFVEGADVVTAFWHAREPQGKVYYAQHTKYRSRG